MGAREYYENVLQEAFGVKLAGMLPDILKALPPDRAEALAAVAKVRNGLPSAHAYFEVC